MKTLNIKFIEKVKITPIVQIKMITKKPQVIFIKDATGKIKRYNFKSTENCMGIEVIEMTRHRKAS